MKKSNRMLRLTFIIAMTVALACVANVFIVSLGKLHIRSMTSLEPYVQSVALVSENIYAKRGNIYDAGGEVVAQNKKTYNIICYLDSSRIGNKNTIAYVDDPLYTSQVLSTFLDMDQEEIYYYLTYNPNLYQTELGLKGRNLSEETVEAILSYPNIHGIGFVEATSRIYPKGEAFAPYLIGFAQNDEEGKLRGKMGLELYLNDELSGTDGKHTYQTDKHGYILDGMYEEYVPSSDGFDVYTTLDSSLQDALDIAFENITSDNNASSAWGSVVELETGKILAWGQTPGFDPNVLEIENYNNQGSQVPYEPGSVMKAFIYATAMDLGTYDGETEFDSDSFCYLSNGASPYRTYGSENFGCISNASGKSWGYIPLDYGLIYSSNVATSTLLTDYVGVDNFIEYLDRFGFFKNVNTDGIAENAGSLNYTWPAEKLALTYGQGSSVTMLQLLQAYTAIFGNGQMLKPYFIDKIVDTNTDTVVYQGKKTIVGEPIKEETAKQMQTLMERVVSDKGGTARFYAVDEVAIMAKTGTSELIESGAYQSNDSITSVMLAFPAEQPKYMLYFAYISPYDYNNHTYSTPVKDFIRRVALLTNVEYKQIEDELNEPISQYVMPDFCGQNYFEGYDELVAMGCDVYKIGNGDLIIDQYPKAKDRVYSREKVFLLTNNQDIQIPDFKGWTRKELIAYWQLSKLPIKINGYGIVNSQTIEPGSIYDGYSDLSLELADITAPVDSQEEWME